MTMTKDTQVHGIKRYVHGTLLPFSALEFTKGIEDGYYLSPLGVKDSILLLKNLLLGFGVSIMCINANDKVDEREILKQGSVFRL